MVFKHAHCPGMRIQDSSAPRKIAADSPGPESEECSWAIAPAAERRRRRPDPRMVRDMEYYKLLQIGVTANEKEIRQAYRTAVVRVRNLSSPQHEY